MPKRDPRLLAFAKQMRREPTPAEEKLWSLIRAGRLDGVKFSNQVLICGFLADFAARSRKLVIEIDGDGHDFTAERDAQRTTVLEANDYRMIRFTNDDVMNNADGVLAVIRQALQSTLSPPGRGTAAQQPGRGAVCQTADSAPLPPRFARHPLPGGERVETNGEKQ